MLCKIKFELKTDSALSFNMSSLFQGVLMEEIAKQGYSNYIDELHISSLHDYTQHLEHDFSKDQWYWVINTISEKAYDIIYVKTLSKLKEFELKKHNIKVIITNSEIRTLSKQELFDCFKANINIDKIRIDFLTPTAFKSDGNYIFIPELPLIFKSLINKYDAAFSQETITDQDTFEQICTNSKVSSYKLKSTLFHLEGVKIPAFEGNLYIKCNRNQTLTNFLYMLFRFGEFCGVGIKTGIGMGAIKCTVFESQKLR